MRDSKGGRPPGATQPTLNELLAKYNGKVRLAYRDFPLSPVPPYAQKTAEASRYAGEQGKFWDYHRLLFANQSPTTGRNRPNGNSWVQPRG
jgi:protein-disulfide isomerase